MEPLKLALEWFKKNWIVVAIAAVVGFLLWQNFAQRSLVDSMAEENRKAFERHTADLQAMQETHAAEIAAQHEINQRLEENLTRIETEYTDRMSALETRTRVRRETTVREVAGNPDEMARRLQERLGWNRGTP